MTPERRSEIVAWYRGKAERMAPSQFRTDWLALLAELEQKPEASIATLEALEERERKAVKWGVLNGEAYNTSEDAWTAYKALEAAGRQEAPSAPAGRCICGQLLSEHGPPPAD